MLVFAPAEEQRPQIGALLRKCLKSGLTTPGPMVKVSSVRPYAAHRYEARDRVSYRLGADPGIDFARPAPT